MSGINGDISNLIQSMMALGYTREAAETEAKKIVESAGLEFSNPIQGDTFQPSSAAAPGTSKIENPDFSNIGDIEAKYNELQAKIASCEAAIESYEKTLKAEIDKQAELQEKDAALGKEIAALTTSKDDALKANQAAKAQKESMKSSYEDRYAAAVESAKSKYNKNKDGYWDEYLSRYLFNEGVTQPNYSSIDAEIKSTSGTFKDLSGKLSAANSEKIDIGNQLTTCNTNISTYSQYLTAETNQKSILEAQCAQYAEVMECINKLPEEEKEFIKSLGDEIDLTATNEDGTAKYVFAQGADKQYHLYIRDGKGTYEDSVVREYANGGGYDIIASGSGRMYNLKEATDETASSAKEVFWITDVGVESNKFTYQTTSPLSFDINGDGVTTSNIFTNFDIDGDGTLDTINDSADFVLAFDSDGDGNIGENGLEVFGNITDIDGDGKSDGYKNGFEALKALAQKEGLISEGDMKLDADDLKKLQEKYKLGMKDGYNGEYKTFEELGITEINLSDADTELDKNFDGKGNDKMTQEGATFIVNGEEREYVDLWHRHPKKK